MVYIYLAVMKPLKFIITIIILSSLFIACRKSEDEPTVITKSDYRDAYCGDFKIRVAVRTQQWGFPASINVYEKNILVGYNLLPGTNSFNSFVNPEDDYGMPGIAFYEKGADDKLTTYRFYGMYIDGRLIAAPSIIVSGGFTSTDSIKAIIKYMQNHYDRYDTMTGYRIK